MRNFKQLLLSVVVGSTLSGGAYSAITTDTEGPSVDPIISSEKSTNQGVSLPDPDVLQRLTSARGPYRSVANDSVSQLVETKRINRCDGAQCSYDNKSIVVKLAKDSSKTTTPSSGIYSVNSTTTSTSKNTSTPSSLLDSAKPIFSNAVAPKSGTKIMTASGEVIDKPDLTRWYKIELDQNTTVDAAIEQLDKDARVELVEVNFERKISAGEPTSFNDPQESGQWYLDTAKIKQAWTWLTDNDYQAGGNRDVVVAVIDSGVDYNHEDLAVNMWVNQGEIPNNGIDDDNNGYVDDIHGVSVVGSYYDHNGDPMDDHGHGTHVAGVIAAEADNNIGITGIAHNVQIMAIKAAQYSGVLTATDIAEAVTYASEQGADVINMSFGGNYTSLLEEDALAVAFGKAVLIASAGNNGLPNEAGCLPIYAESFPAGYPWVLGVMAESPAPALNGDYLAGFSSFDCKPQTGIEYELMAPGVDILSTLPNNGYAKWDGTSMAAPVVSGMAALLRSKFNDKSVHSSRFLMGQLGATGPVKQGVTFSKNAPPTKYHSADALEALTNTPKPNLAYLEHWLWDENTTNANNDDDGIVDAGETIDLALIVRNYWGQANNVNVTIEAKVERNGIDTPDPYITWDIPTVNYGSVGTYSNDDNGLIYENDEVTGVRSPFRFTVAENTPNNHIIPFIVTFTATNGLDDEDNTIYTSSSKFNLLVHRGRELPSIIDGDRIGTEGGNLDTDGIEDGIVTLDDSALYIVDKPVLVEKGVTLKAGPGAIVQFWGSQPDDTYSVFQNAYLQVEGTFLVEGTVEKPVTLKPSDLFPDRMVVIKQGNSGKASINYADITNVFMNGFGSYSEDGSEVDPLYKHVKFRRGYEGSYLSYQKNESGNWSSTNASQLSGNAIDSHLIGLGGIYPWENEDVRSRSINLPPVTNTLIERSNFSAGRSIQSGNVLLGNFKKNQNGAYFSSKITSASIVQDFKILESLNYNGKTYAIFHNKSSRYDSKLLDDAQAFAQSISENSHVITFSDLDETIAINDWLYNILQRKESDWETVSGCELNPSSCYNKLRDDYSWRILTGLKRNSDESYSWLNKETPEYDFTEGQYYWDRVQWRLNHGRTPSEDDYDYKKNANAVAIKPVISVLKYLNGELQSTINNTFSQLETDDPRRAFEPSDPLTFEWIEQRLNTYITDSLNYELEEMLNNYGSSSFEECLASGHYQCTNAGSAEQWKANRLSDWEDNCDQYESNCRYHPPNYSSWYNAQYNNWIDERFKASWDSGFIQNLENIYNVSNPLVLIELDTEHTLEELQTQVLTFKESWSSDTFKNNAILNQWWDPNPDHWLQIDAGDGDSSRFYKSTMDLSGNYWGTTNTDLIGYSIVDYSDDFNKAEGKISPALTVAPESAYPFVANVKLLDADKASRADLRFGAETMVWQVEFNRDMDTDVQPAVNFGPEYPYTDFAVNGDWVDARTWEGQVRISPVASDGYQYVRVSGAVAADDAWLVTGVDYARYRFEVITSGTESLNLQASGGDGYVDLSWSQDDFDTFYGFNLYRSTSPDSGFIRISQSLIGNEVREYRDENVQPGITYYYHFTVSSGDGESEPSNVSNATPNDTVKPEITHAQIVSGPYGSSQLVQANVTDNISVDSVTLYYRVQGTSEYIAVVMQSNGDSTYSASIPGDAMISPGIEYYIEASDGSSVSYSGRADSPNKTVVVDAPVVTNLSPVSGGIEGGTVVTVVGANFKDGLTVDLGGAACTPVEYVNASKVKCTTAAHAPNVVSVTVKNPDDKEGKLTRAFTYIGDDVQVGMPEFEGATGQVIDVPLSINGVSGLASYETSISFNSAHLKLVNVRKGNLTSAWNIAEHSPTISRVNIASVAAGGTVTGAGELAVLEFLVLADSQVSSDIVIESLSLNDDAITTTQFNGKFVFLPGFTVSGALTYWNNSSVKVAADVVLNNNVVTSTAVDTGAYTLTGVKPGTNKVSFDKNDQTNNITAYDASLILQHVVGISTLSSSAQIAADTNNNGSVSAMDAFEILNYAVGLADLPFENHLSSWTFSPKEHEYSNLNADQSNVNSTGILIGDVSGNWGENSGIANVDKSLYFGAIKRLSAEQYSIDVMVEPSQDISAIEFDLSFSDDLEFVSATRTEAISNWSMVMNNANANAVSIALANATPLTETTSVVTLVFNTNSVAPVLTLAAGMVNETQVSVLNISVMVDLSETDSDSDGVMDDEDAMPFNPEESLDTDNDGIGNNEDTDDDGDGVLDFNDALPLDSDESIDTDLDGIGNNADLDDDNDGVSDIEELKLGLNPSDANSKPVDNYLAESSMVSIGDIDNDGITDIGLFGLNITTNRPELRRYSASLQGEQIDVISWAARYDTIKFVSMPDSTDDKINELALFARRIDGNNLGKWQLDVKDGADGASLSSFIWPANWTDTKVKLLSDLTDDGINEVALEGRFKDGNRPQLFVKDGSNPTSKVAVYSYPDNWHDAQYIELNDLNQDGRNEIGLFGITKKKGNVQIKVKEGSNSSLSLPAYNIAPKWENISLHKLDDVNNDGLFELGVFGQEIEGKRWQLITKSGATHKGVLSFHSWPNDMSNVSFYVIPDMNGDDVDDYGVFGERDGKYQLFIKSGKDRNDTIGRYNWAMNWLFEQLVILPDSNDDGLPEFGLFGVNNSNQNSQLAVVSGNTAEKGLMRTFNFGSHWIRQQIKVVDDVNGDGINDIGFFGVDSENQLPSVLLFNSVNQAEQLNTLH